MDPKTLAAATLIRAAQDAPDRLSKAVQVKDTPGIWARATALARPRGMSVTAWVREAVREKLARDEVAR